MTSVLVAIFPVLESAPILIFWHEETIDQPILRNSHYHKKQTKSKHENQSNKETNKPEDIQDTARALVAEKYTLILGI